MAKKQPKEHAAKSQEQQQCDARRQLREPEFRKWCESMGFSGIFKASAPAFIAHWLGISEGFIREVIGGRANFSDELRGAMRAVARQHHTRNGWSEVRYGLFTAAIDTEPAIQKLLKTKKQKKPTAKKVEDQATPEVIPRGKTGKVVLVVTVADTTHVVTLPRGTKVSGTPTVIQGAGKMSGSIQIVFTKTSTSRK